MRTSALRWFVLANWVGYVVGYFLPAFTAPKDPALVSLLSWDGYGALLEHNALFVAPLLLISFATVGLVFYQNWGRYLFLFTCAFVLLGSFVFGYRVAAPLDAFFGSLCGLLSGAILGLVFLSPMCNAFASDHGA